MGDALGGIGSSPRADGGLVTTAGVDFARVEVSRSVSPRSPVMRSLVSIAMSSTPPPSPIPGRGTGDA